MAGFQRNQVEGLRELDAALALLDTEVATKLGVTAGRKSAQALEGELKSVAPYRAGQHLKYWSTSGGRSNSRDYGHLRDNIKVRKARSRETNYIVFNVTTGQAFWGYFLEYGTVNMAAKPWARPAVERMKDELVSIQIDILGKGINRIAAQVAKGKMLPNGRRA